MTEGWPQRDQRLSVRTRQSDKALSSLGSLTKEDRDELKPSQSDSVRYLSEEVEQLQLGHVITDFLNMEALIRIAEKLLNKEVFHHVVTLNPEMVMLAETDPVFRQATQAAELRVPDGAGLIWAQWYIRSQFWSLIPSLIAFSFRSVERVPGVEVVERLAKLCAANQKPMYLLGGTGQQVKISAAKLQQRFPRLKVFTSPEHAFDITGPRSILSDIEQKQPAVLLVAYGAPKQTIWIERHREDMPSVCIAVGVGGAFAILSEENPRAPRWLQKLNLEWLWRLALEPKRLPRIWQATVRFPLLINRLKRQQSAQHS